MGFWDFGCWGGWIASKARQKATIVLGFRNLALPALAAITLVLLSGCTLPAGSGGFVFPTPTCGNGECSGDEVTLGASGNIISTTCKADCGSCTDTDRGVNYYLAGSATELSGQSISDVCSGDVLVEAFCSRNELKSVAKKCELGCSAGACSGSGAALADGNYCVYSDQNMTIVKALGERACGVGDEAVYECALRNNKPTWSKGEDCAGRSPARECWQGTCVQPTSPELMLLEMDECSGPTAFDSSGKVNDANVEAVPGWIAPTIAPAWVRDTPTGTGCSLDFTNSNTVMATPITDTISGVASNIENSMTAEAWIKPTQSKPAWIMMRSWQFYIFQWYRNVWVVVYIEDVNIPWHYESFTAWTQPIKIGEWNHIAFTYDASKREAKIYVNGKVEGGNTIPEEHITLSHGGRSRLKISPPKGIAVNGPVWYSSYYGFKGLIDGVKVYDYVKTCFDLTPDNGVDDCATCKAETVKVYSATAEASEDAKCPQTARVETDTVGAFALNSATNLFEKQVAAGDVLCIAEPIVVRQSKAGKYAVTEPALTRRCDEKCFKSCTGSCADNYFEQCITSCKAKCTNGVCMSSDTATMCSGTGGLTTQLCIDYFDHYGNKTSTCHDITLDPACNYCFTQCAPDNYDTTANTVTYDKACGFELNETVEFRKGVGGADCTGDVVASYNLAGIGTEAVQVNAPSKPGNYQLCFNGKPLWGGSIKKEGCPPQTGCIIKSETPKFRASANQKNSMLRIKMVLTNITDKKKQYSYYLYSKIQTNETKSTATGDVPDYMALEPLSSANVGAPIGLDENTTFYVNVNIPDRPVRLRDCYKERGNEESCERARFDTSDPNRMPFYKNIIVRAEASGSEGYYCETPIEIDMTSTCGPEAGKGCNNADDDCDGIVDEGVVEVEAVKPLTRTDDDGTALPAGFEPLAGLTVGFYNRGCAEQNGLNWAVWQDYLSIIAACTPAATCITDAEGYCAAEVPGNQQYTAIGVLQDGTTVKHLGMPVAMVHCGQTKKTWHLAYME